jgi:putative sterol carrier protein
MTVEELLNGAIEAFNKKAETDPKLLSEIEGKLRRVFIELTDMEGYCFVLENCRVGGLQRGKNGEPDIHITTDSATLEALMKKEMGPMKALVTKRLKLTKISMEDLGTLRKFF